MLKMPPARYALKLGENWQRATQRRQYQICDLEGQPLEPNSKTGTACYMSVYSLAEDTITPAKTPARTLAKTPAFSGQHERVSPVWDEYNNAPSVLTLYCTQDFNQATRLSEDAAQRLTRAAWKRGLSLEMIPVGLSGWIQQQQSRLLAWVNRKAGEPPHGLK